MSSLKNSMHFWLNRNKHIFSPLLQANIVVLSLIFAISFLLLQVIFLNIASLIQVFAGSLSISSKLYLIFTFFFGYFTMFSLGETIFTIGTALLIGYNLTLVLAVYQNIKQSGDMRVSVGGISILALLSTGCPSCGFSILSLLGPSTGFLALALQHPLIKLAIFVSLTFSIVYNLKKLDLGKYCKLPLTHEGK